MKYEEEQAAAVVSSFGLIKVENSRPDNQNFMGFSIAKYGSTNTTLGWGGEYLFQYKKYQVNCEFGKLAIPWEHYIAYTSCYNGSHNEWKLIEVCRNKDLKEKMNGRKCECIK